MNVYIHIFNSDLHIDETPAIYVDLPFEPHIGDKVWLTESQLDKLKAPIIENYTQNDVLTWSDYLYCRTCAKLQRGDDYKTITKEEFAKDLDFGDANIVRSRLINLCDDDESVLPGLHIELAKDLKD